MPNKNKKQKIRVAPEVVAAEIEESKKDKVVKDLAAEIKKLNKSIDTLKTKHFYRYASHPLKLFGLNFLKGIITGMAAVIGATALVALFVYFTSQAGILPDWFQDWLNNILEIVQSAR